MCTNCFNCNKENKFCLENAQHSDNPSYSSHTFNCDCEKKLLFNGMDLCFIIDGTNSMSLFIDETKNIIKNIIKKFESKIINYSANSTNTKALRIALVVYRDHNDPDTLIEFKKFDSALSIIDFLDKVKPQCGQGNFAAIADGIDKALNLDWSSETNTKLMFLILDRGPKEHLYNPFYPKIFSPCECGLKLEPLIRKIDINNINFNVIKAESGYLNKMEEEIKKINIKVNFVDLGSQETLTVFNEEVTDIICKSLKDIEFTVSH